MKKLQEIEEDVSLRRFGCSLFEALPRMDFMEVVEFTNDVAYEYAQQACEDLRERIAEEAKVKTVATPLGDYHEVNKESIINTPIILP